MIYLFHNTVVTKIKNGKEISKSSVKKLADRLLEYPHIMENNNLPKNRDKLIETLSVDP